MAKRGPKDKGIHNASRYSRKNDPCRCEICSTDARVKGQAWRAARLAFLQAHPRSDKHGRGASYDAGCRCIKCIAANSVRNTAKKKRIHKGRENENSQVR